jgi:shikimate kinase
MGKTAPEDRLILRKPLVLIGMMGAGKSAVGRALADCLGVEIRDSDAEIEASARLSIAEIFDRYGEAFFREKEAAVIARLLEGPPCVLSTGGGAWLSAATRALLLPRAAVVWLEADLDLLWSRVRHKNTRPLLRTSDPKATLSDLLAARTPAYSLAPLKVTVEPGWSIEETAGKVVEVLRRDGALEVA